MKHGNKLKEQKAITLIALVITVVVMLILAGVTINLTLRENGIFTTAQQAAKNYTDAQNKEMVDLGDFTNLVNETINGLGQAGNAGETEIPEVKVTGLRLNKTSTIIELNRTETLTATIIPENATNKNVTWTSSDETVATVENGTVTALKVGNTTITATAQDGSGVSANCEVEVVKQGKLSEIITGEDYGKYIDYAVTVEGTTLDKWRVFYNDKTTNNVYIILDGYLPNTLIPEETGMTTEGTCQAYWDTTNFSTNEQAVATLKNTTYWSAFAGGLNGATAYGGPTNTMFVNSWNENTTVNSKTLSVETLTTGLTDSSKLYIPYTESVDGCNGYWLASPRVDYYNHMWDVDYSGRVYYHDLYNIHYGIRPLVCLPSGITGTVGTSVRIDK